MQITLTEVDIRAGIALYLTARGITGVTAENLQATFKAGRKGSGLTAEVTTNLSNPVSELKDEKGTVRAKSSADLPTALNSAANGTAVAGESTNIEGADEAAKELQARRDAADKKETPAESPAPVVEEKAADPAPVVETKEEGGSLFS